MSEEKPKPKRASRAKKTASVVDPQPATEVTSSNIVLESAPSANEHVHFSIVQDPVVENDSLHLDKIKYIEETVENIQSNEITHATSILESADDPNSKKRGRKPKGGKIIHQIAASNENIDAKPTVILHLRCFMKDLKVQQDNLGDYCSFSFDSGFGFGSSSTPTADYHGQSENNYTMIKNNTSSENSSIYINNTANESENCTVYNEKDVEMKEIWKKLKQLEHSLHVNSISDKKSACFWCTYDFDNPPIYIPKYFLKNSYHVYGCFCSPECSVAYLMNESLDSSSKFERYHLLNHIYAKIYDYKKNIKPAPNPYYMLEKYYGNMSIQEYRALLSNERLFLIVDKPLTRIMPELHQDNEEHIINNRKIIPSNNQSTKKKVAPRKIQTKSNIVNEKFGMASSAAM